MLLVVPKHQTEPKADSPRRIEEASPKSPQGANGSLWCRCFSCVSFKGFLTEVSSVADLTKTCGGR